MVVFLWAGLGFLMGAIPFSVLLGRFIAHKDIRQFGDGNPGAVNVWKVGGWLAGLLAVLLDFLKAFIPVGIAFLAFSISGWGLVAVALAPLLGHAFSPFLDFRGGKAVAATFGIWAGLTLWEGPAVLGISMGILFVLQKNDAWTVMITMLAFLVYLLVNQADIIIFTIWGSNIIILGWKHRHYLREMPRLRKWILDVLRFPK